MSKKKVVTKPEVVTTSADRETIILVIKLGWVLVGNPTPADDPTKFAMNNSHVIRIWGTTRGLGEIAIAGPTKDTVLDPCGYVEANHHSILFQIACKSEHWSL